MMDKTEDRSLQGGQSASQTINRASRDPGPPPEVNQVAADAPTLSPPHGDAGPLTSGHGWPTVPGHDIRAELGRGGMGVVYLAEQTRLQRMVAVKMILHGGHASTAELNRFRAEAEAVARLQHPNIVQIHEVGEADGCPYFSLEYCAGGSLAAKLDGTPWPAHPAAEFIETLARAVHAAHESGIVHRDLKPANILLSPTSKLQGPKSDVEPWTSDLGRFDPKITDFGLAKRMDAEHGPTMTGTVLGTPSYMAPEQAAGTKNVGPAADVYSLGAVLYELLTGRPPFRAATPLDTVLQVIHDEPVPPRQLQPRLPRDLETICLTCLQKDPARRYRSAAALADDLRRWLHHEPILARPTSMVLRAWKWIRRHPATAALCATGVAATVALLTIVSVYNQHLQAALAGANAQKVVADQRAQLLAEEQKQSEARLWTAHFEQARAERLAGQPWRALELLTEAARQRLTPEVRQEAIQAVTTAGIRRVCHLKRFNMIISGDGAHMAFSSDGQLLASEDAAGITVWRIPSGERVGQTECVSEQFRFNPVNHLLAVFRHNKISLWDPESNRERASFKGGAPFCFSPAGQRLAFAAGNRVGLWDIARQRQTLLGAHGQPVAFITGDELLVQHDGRVGVWSLRAGRELFQTPRGWSLNSGSWSNAAAGQLAAFRQGDKWWMNSGSVAIWDLSARRQVATLKDVPALPFRLALCLSQAGSLIAYPDSRAGQIKIFNPQRQQVENVFRGGGFQYGRFSPDGAFLASSETVSGNVRVWNLATGLPLTYLPYAGNPVWSPDGRYLAVWAPGQWPEGKGAIVGGSRSAVDVYEVMRGTPAGHAGSFVQALTFSRDGQRLAAQEGVWQLAQQVSGLSLFQVSDGPQRQGRYFASGGRIWRYDLMPPVASQVFPTRRDVVLPWPDEPRHAPETLPTAVGASPDGTALLIDWQRRISNVRIAHQLDLFDVNQGKQKRVWVKPEKQAWWTPAVLQFSPDGRHAAVSGNGRLAIWDVQRSTRLHSIPLTIEKSSGNSWTSDASAAAFSADGRLIYVATDNGAVFVIDIESGRIRRAWMDTAAKARAVAMSPDSKLLAIARDDGLIHLWDPATGRELARWEPHPGGATALAFHPQRPILASGASDGTVKLWDLEAIQSRLAALGLGWQ